MTRLVPNSAARLYQSAVTIPSGELKTTRLGDGLLRDFASWFLDLIPSKDN